jgi:hypothetical protein
LRDGRLSVDAGTDDEHCAHRSRRWPRPFQHHRIEDSRLSLERGDDWLRVDVDPSGRHDALTHPTQKRESSAIVPPPQVTGVEPSLIVDRRPPDPGGDDVGPTHQDLPVSGDPNLHAGQRFAE